MSASRAWTAEEDRLRRRMYWLLGATFVHVLFEGGLGLVVSIVTGSLALHAHSIQALIEGGAAFLALRHLPRLSDTEEDHSRHEHRLARWIGIAFLLLAAYVAARGVHELLEGHHAEPTLVGLLLTIYAALVMPIVGWVKFRTARRLGSEGLAAEAKESISCAILSFLTLVAMAGGLLGAPGWLDPALSLLMVPWFLREGLAHVRGRVHAHLAGGFAHGKHG
ncbi:MAG TPA: cation transporter [Thermoanaerobaculia bacterium]|jgi:divalent metal cation (Fe/Co/Zn/Cd) transporter